jgi:hypothetical protein
MAFGAALALGCGGTATGGGLVTVGVGGVPYSFFSNASRALAWASVSCARRGEIMRQRRPALAASKIFEICIRLLLRQISQ